MSEATTARLPAASNDPARLDGGRRQGSFSLRLRVALALVVMPCVLVGLVAWAGLGRAEKQGQSLDETVGEQGIVSRMKSELRHAEVEANLLADADLLEYRAELGEIMAELDRDFTIAQSFDQKVERDIAARADQSWRAARALVAPWLTAPMGELDTSSLDRFHALVDSATTELSALDESTSSEVRSFNADLQRDRGILVVALAAAAFMTAWVARRLRLAIYRPLRQLESSLDRVSANGLRERVEITGDREFHAVADAMNDMSDRLQLAIEELEHQAFHDSLTGLANRALFHDRVEHALQRSLRTGTDVAVVYLDIDGFKAVNDSRGHDSGDQVLREVAARLVSAVRVGDTVARLGGDEFAILVEGTTHPLDEASTIADRVLQSLTAPVALDGQHIVLSASIGIAIGEAASTSLSLLRDADIAMYRARTLARRSGRSTTRRWAPPRSNDWNSKTTCPGLSTGTNSDSYINRSSNSRPKESSVSRRCCAGIIRHAV